MSGCTMAMLAAKIAVVPPMIPTTASAVGAYSNSGDRRATMYTPAATIVAAWINADTGVGPSIASGNPTCNGTCALLPTAPVKINTPINARVPDDNPRDGNLACNSAKLNVPAYDHNNRMPSII